ncbi:MAG TPA: hypothetical protein VHK01_18705 [Lacipirellulaceae bacterium]|jgi:hypothetical protein|nr:hypothetical protein [Lacipirellulaceae bacterium]
MPLFVHLAPESRTTQIRRNGISRLRKAVDGRPSGIFAVPVTRNFYISHQWLRELKRRGHCAIAGVYFRIGDDELVWVGHYGRVHQPMSAVEAAAEFMSSDSREGWEVIIPRRIDAKEIHRIRRLPQVLGWRYYPSAKGKAPVCACKFCTRGEYGARKLRQRLGTDDD